MTVDQNKKQKIPDSYGIYISVAEIVNKININIGCDSDKH